MIDTIRIRPLAGSYDLVNVIRYLIVAWLLPWSAIASGIEVRPLEVTLRGPESAQQLLILDTVQSGATADLTRQVDYRVADPSIATVDSDGRVRPGMEGDTEIVIRHAEGELTVPIAVHGIDAPPPVSFLGEVTPLLSKFGCNAGQCHAKAEGQAGFKLSVFAEDAAADHGAIARQGFGRRMLPVAPEKSLILLKATAQVSHGGKQRFSKDSPHYRRLARWIAEGARLDEHAGNKPWARIEVDPAVSVMTAGLAQQLRVTAISADGTPTCVTEDAEYEVNATVIAEVGHHGLVQSTGNPGEVAVLVRFLNHVAVARLTVPQQAGDFVRPPENNFVDQQVWDKLQRLNIQSSGLAEDGPFLRRLFLDTIGTLPTLDEVRQFLADQDPNKRTRVIDEVLQRAEYADFWTLLWSDLMRVNREKMTPQGALAMTRWLWRQFDQNRPYDELVQELLTVEGSLLAEGPAPFFKAMDSPEVLGRSVSQLFLGVRIDCAQCQSARAPAQMAPTIGYVFPPAASPGTTVHVRLGGYDWTPDLQFFVHDPRIELEILSPPGPILVPEPPYWFGEKSMAGALPLPREIEAKITVPSDMPPGPISWQVANANGGSGLGQFYIAENREVVENSDSQSAQRIGELPVSVSGQLTHIEEVDRYQLSTPENGPVTCRLDTRLATRSFSSPRIVSRKPTAVHFRT